MRDRGVVGVVAGMLLVAGCGGGGDRISSGDLPSGGAKLRVSSSAFSDGSRLPTRYTCDGAGDEPRVGVARVPGGTHGLGFSVSDPAGPGGTFVPLPRYGGKEGRNSAGRVGWTPPCPPKGDGPHHYVWTF